MASRAAETDRTENRVLATAQHNLVSQARALERAAERLDHHFVDAVTLLSTCTGRVVVAGMGKSGIVARKIAATLACTGVPSFFLHPAEAAHGDLGAVTSADVVVLVSRSGETREVLRLLPHFETLGVPIVALTGKRGSRIGRAATVELDASVDREACPHGIVPTTSALVAQALGDALALALVRGRGLTPGDLTVLHPSLDDDSALPGRSVEPTRATPTRARVAAGPSPMVRRAGGRTSG